MTDVGRREHARAAVSITGDLRTSLDPSFSRMMMEDLSMGGAFVRTRFPLPEGVEVNLKFPIMGRAFPVHVTGVVAWSRDQGGVSGMGIEFSNISSDDLRDLRVFIDQLISNIE